MKIRFWGVRGSIPTPLTTHQLRAKLKSAISRITPEDIRTPGDIDKFINRLPLPERNIIGGNTSCLEVRADDKILIFDMGSGLKGLGNHLIRHEQNKDGLEIHIFMSHTHWDHLIGFPFFTPAFLPQNKLFFYSIHPRLRERLEIQQDFRFFPVSLDNMSSQKEFIELKHHEEFQLGNIKIRNHPLYHPGGSFGYRVEYDNKVFIYATDSEYKETSGKKIEDSIAFFKGANILVFDAQYTFEEAIHKEDWGHSSALIGIDYAIEAGVEKLVLFHHEPERDDFEISDILQKSINYKKMNYPTEELEVILAHEGLEFEL